MVVMESNLESCWMRFHILFSFTLPTSQYQSQLTSVLPIHQSIPTQASKPLCFDVNNTLLTIVSTHCKPTNLKSHNRSARFILPVVLCRTALHISEIDTEGYHILLHTVYRALAGLIHWCGLYCTDLGSPRHKLYKVRPMFTKNSCCITNTTANIGQCSNKLWSIYIYLYYQ